MLLGNDATVCVCVCVGVFLRIVFRLGLQSEVGGIVGVQVRGWVTHHANESHHKDGNTRVCVWNCSVCGTLPVIINCYLADILWVSLCGFGSSFFFLRKVGL